MSKEKLLMLSDEAEEIVFDVEPWLYARFTGILENMHSFKKY